MARNFQYLLTAEAQVDDWQKFDVPAEDQMAGNQARCFGRLLKVTMHVEHTSEI